MGKTLDVDIENNKSNNDEFGAKTTTKNIESESGEKAN